MERASAIFMDEVWGSTVGSPKKVLRFQTWYFAWTIGCFVCFAVQVVVFPVVMLSYEEDLLWVALVTIFSALPCLISAAQAVAIWRARQACSSLVIRFHRFGERVADAMIRNVHGSDSDFAMRCSVILSFYLFFCLFFEGFLPPCNQFEGLTVWKYGMAAVPCEMWEFFCAWFLVSHLVFGLVTIALPKVIERFRVGFTPEGRTGLPEDMLALLPSHEFGSGAAEEADSSCTICIEDFQEGERVRRLPCGHAFHTSCVDAWLSKKPTCPLRCHNNLWEVVRGLAAEAGMLPQTSGTLSASVSAPDASGTVVVAAGRGQSPQPASIGRPAD